jgi:hypothetical protein
MPRISKSTGDLSVNTQLMREGAEKYVQERQRRRSRRITAGAYSAYYFDEWNWVVSKDRNTEEGTPDDNCYYPNIEGALKCLLRKVAGDKAADTKDIKAVLAAIADADRHIEAAVKEMQEAT